MRRAWLLFAQTVTIALALLFVVATLKPEWLGRSPGSLLPNAAPAAVEPATVSLPAPVRTVTLAGGSAPGSYAEAAKRAAPGVVSITASRASAERPRADDPMFRYFFGNRAQRMPQERQVGIGSGVIVSAEGYLLTNNHVIEGADDIEVALGDGRTASAKVVGTDPESDLAVLKIATDKLSPIAFADVDALQVGDVVLAIGNPFGVGQTVTSGIVSAIGRTSLNINTFENFIQTDAAINPGNSGGALVDTSGNLLGINTAIYSRSGGSLGIGFAIPVSTARQVMDGLIRDGQVIRGYIGVEPRDLTPEIARTLNLAVRRGVLITGVAQDGPAAEGGMRPGDIVTAIAGKEVGTTSQLLNTVAALKPRQATQVRVQRGRDAVDLNVVVAQRPRAAPRAQQDR